VEKDVVYAIGILRVSSGRQITTGDSIEQQKLQIQYWADNNKWKGKRIIVKNWVNFALSATGELKVQPVIQIVDYCRDKKNNVSLALIKSIDRFTRAGRDIYKELKKLLLDEDVYLLDTSGFIRYETINTLGHLGVGFPWSTYNPSEEDELRQAEKAKEDVRDILTKLIGAEISYVRKGYRVRPAPYGFRNEKKFTVNDGVRIVLVPNPEESSFIIKMFELEAQGNLSDKQIVEKINKLGFKTRQTHIHDKQTGKVVGIKKGIPLKVKQLQRFIQRPIYAGVSVERWTYYLPVKAMFKGLVSIELFNKANKGKVFISEDRDGNISLIKGKTPEWLLTKNKDNPLFAFKRQVLCPICKRPLKGSSPRNKRGIHIRYYHCSVSHKYWGINANNFDEVVNSFVKHLHFTQDFKDKFQSIVLDEWDKRKVSAIGDSITLEQRVTKLRQEQLMLIEKAKETTSPILLKSIESDIEQMETKILQTTVERNDKEEDELDIKKAIAYCKYYMEHLEELILSGSDTLKNAAMFGLVFEAPPTFDELKDGTPKLAPIFELNEAYKTSKNQSVTPLGIEPRLLG
jgi:hypothetical protein